MAKKVKFPSPDDRPVRRGGRAFTDRYGTDCCCPVAPPCYAIFSRCPCSPPGPSIGWMFCSVLLSQAPYVRDESGVDPVCWQRIGEATEIPPESEGIANPVAIGSCEPCCGPIICPTPEECAALCLGSYTVNIPAWSFTDEFGVFSNWTAQGVKICKGDCANPNPLSCGYSGCKQVFPAGTITFPGERPAEAEFIYYIALGCAGHCAVINGLWEISLTFGCNGFTFPLGYYTNGVISKCAQPGIYARIPSCSSLNSPPYLQLT